MPSRDEKVRKEYIVDLVVDAFLRIRSGQKRVFVETENGTTVSAYKLNEMIRIDVVEKEP